ncbi:hypothetical protein [Iodidimonas sp. SYSU 1G8]|uniref:hypothetical protein n=1 Tax=Iodidimonas sp. SYSU 1G8 TaxID=3133967 RepID=UPI0031FF1832
MASRTRGRSNPWMDLWFDTWTLGIEASTVITLRTMKIGAGGSAADAEARKMVEEKIAAGVALQQLALRGGLGTSAVGAAARTVAHYRRKVRANRRRLSK